MTLREVAARVRKGIPEADSIRVVGLGPERIGIAAIWREGRKVHTHGTTISLGREIPKAVAHLRGSATKQGLIGA